MIYATAASEFPFISSPATLARVSVESLKVRVLNLFEVFFEVFLGVRFEHVFGDSS